MPDIPDGDFVYRLVVDGHDLKSRLMSCGPLRVGDLFPLAESGGEVKRIFRDGDEGSYEIHVAPIG